MTVARISSAFANAASQSRAALVLYVMAGDPTLEKCEEVLDALVEGGADIIELGFPFSDPMAEGPSIQLASQRALANGVTLKKTLAIAQNFRAKHSQTGLILMGYLNPIESMGYEVFAKNAANAGVDGVIVVDAPPEEDGELRECLKANDIAIIRLAAPTTDAARLPKVIEGVEGFVYYVSVAGVTGVKAIDVAAIKEKVAIVKAAANLPVAIGFGIRTAEAAHKTSQIADGIVIGAAVVDSVFAAHQNGQNCAQVAREFAMQMRAATQKD
ncbi:MAG: tryptophan synthase alpha chain [Hyphomonadaceae bacterium]|nr:MAG: tryptophan synthase alpha chain [Hyphomonadaceae bacterium]KAF0183912.1 MAG: tryptophan synthase alpha chain [Hyphomonadaceae bacterium]